MTHAQPINPFPERFELAGNYAVDAWHGSASGRDADTWLLHDLVLSATVNGDALFQQPSLMLYGSALFTRGDTPNESFVQSLQGISNIEATRSAKLYEAWFEWLSGSHSLKAGLYDLNSEFDVIETAGLFLNPSHGIGADFSQSGANGPSIFPTTSLAVRSWHNHGPWTLQLAALDAVPGNPDHPVGTHIRVSSDDGALLVGELSYAQLSGLRVTLGHWYYSAASAVDETSTDRSHNRGWYSSIEKRWTQQEDGHIGLSTFVRYGQANQQLNDAGSYLGAGVVATGLIPGRAADQFGLAHGAVQASQRFRNTQEIAGEPVASPEHITELTYSLVINPWLTLQPDVQFIQHSGLTEQPGIVMYGLRLNASLNVRR